MKIVTKRDFVQELIPAHAWCYFRKDCHYEGLVPKMHWMPVSNRAQAFLQTAAYSSQDIKLTISVQKIFVFEKIQLSGINRKMTYFEFGSRLKDQNVLIEVMDGYERVFDWGYQHGFFKGIMDTNPTALDYWMFMQSMANDEDQRKAKKYLRAFSGAVNRSFEDILSAV